RLGKLRRTAAPKTAKKKGREAQRGRRTPSRRCVTSSIRSGQAPSSSQASRAREEDTYYRRAYRSGRYRRQAHRPQYEPTIDNKFRSGARLSGSGVSRRSLRCENEGEASKHRGKESQSTAG